MTQTPIEANVVLTTDNSQYDQAMLSSAQQTEALGASVDSLGQKLDRLSKSAGKKLLAFGAADIAGVTGMTVAYGAFEKQLEQLQAQSMTLSRTMGDQRQLFRDYTSEVNSLRGAFGTSTRDAAELVQTLSKLNDGTTAVSKLTENFVRLSAVTGESSTALVNSMTQLQKVMGTPQRETEKLSNQLITLQSRSNASAQAIMDFGSQIAPVARQVGMSTTDVMGFSNAFIKAGQDGYRAASVFNRMMSDISAASASGSPDLAKYSNLVGLTVSQFDKLGGSEKFLRVIESINRQGPQAIASLNQMGYDGASTVRTITALAQSGNLQSELNAARNASPDQLKKSSATAMDGLFDSLSKLRAELTMTGEAFGSKFAKPMSVFVKSMTMGAEAVHKFMDSPIGGLVSWATTGAAGFAAMAGAILLAGKALLTFSSANLLFRNSMTAGFRDTARDMTPAQRALAMQSGIRPGVTPGFMPMGTRGEQMAARNPNFIGNAMYRAGAYLGLRAPAALYGGPGGGPGPISTGLNRLAYYGLTGTGYLARNLVGYQYSPGSVNVPFLAGSGGLTNPAARMRMFNSPTMAGSLAWMGPVGRGIQSGINNVYDRVYGPPQAPATPGTATSVKAGIMGAGATSGAASIVAGINSNAALPAAQQAQATFWQQVKTTAAQFKTLDGATKTFGTGLFNAAKGLTQMTMVMGASGLGAMKTMGGWLGGGLMSIAGNPVSLAMFTAMGAMALKNETKIEGKDYTGVINPYLAAGGLTGVATAPGTGANAPVDPRSVAGALRITRSEAAYANGKNYNLSNSLLKDLTADEAQMMLASSFKLIEKSPQSIQALKLDLINQYGQSRAKSMLGGLSSGQINDSDFNLAGMLEPSFLVQRRWLGWKGEDKAQVGKPFEKVFGAIGDRSNMAYQYGGADARYSQYGADLNALIAGTNAAFDMAEYKPGFRLDLSNGGPNPDDAKDSRTKLSVIAEELAKNGLQGSFTQGDMEVALKAMQEAKSPEGATKAFWKEYFTGTGVTEEDQIKFLDSLGIKNGTDLSTGQRVSAVMGFGMTAKPASTNFDDPDSLASRISNLKHVADLWQDPELQDTLLKTGNANAQMKGAQDFIQKLQDQGLSNAQIFKTLGDIKSTSRTSTASEYQFADLAQQFVGRDTGFALADMNRTDSFGVKADLFRAQMAIKPGDENAQRNQEQAIQDFFSEAQSQKQYFTQLLYQQREYEVMRTRAQEDYDLSREYSEADFQRMRMRAEFDFNLQRERANADFARSQKRASEDFNLSRRRQEEDHNHSVMLMQEQAAQQMYNIYERVRLQRTNSAGYTLFNANEQIQAMQQQSAQLSGLRKKGLSDDAIQQLGLTDPKNAQQLARFWDDVIQDPSLVKKFNAMVQKRIKAAGRLVTDESSTEWQEFQRSYKLSRTRAQDDFEKSMKRGREDFARSMNQMEDDFRRSMHRQQEDYDITMNRQADAYKRTMDRSAEDLNRAAKTIDGNFEDILTKATERLSGHARKQAQAVLSEFEGLKDGTGRKSVAMMEALASIFGVEYTAPKQWRNSGGGKTNIFGGSGNEEHTNGGRYAAGGVIPGWSPGFDNHHYVGPGGQRLSLAGGEGIVVPEVTRALGGEKGIAALNRMGKNGQLGFFLGGVMPTQASEITQHTTGYPFAQWAGDLNDPGQGDYGDPVKSWKSGRVAKVLDIGDRSYGRYVVINHPGGQSSWYAHLSSAGVHPGQKVGAGQYIGNVGDYGNSYGAHLHFEVRGGAEPIGGASGYDGGTMTMADVKRRLMKGVYPGVEGMAGDLSAVQPFSYGMLSGVLNKKYEKSIERYYRKHRDSLYEVAGTVPGDLAHAPENVSGNKALVQAMAAKRGWAGSQWDALYALVMAESGFNNVAQNPTSTAYGMFQFLDSTWGPYGPKTSNPKLQSKYGLQYIADRYKNPASAWDFHQANNWYGDGAVFKGPQTIGVGERGPEMVLPLNEQGADFIQSILARTQVGAESKMTNTYHRMQPMAHNMYNTYNIDRSTQFTGDIRVVADDPNKFLHVLKQRQRAAALSNPAIGGKR